MEIVQFSRWRVAYDRAQTVRAYASIESGGTDSCGCDYCINFARVREEMIPDDVRRFMQTLGVPVDKDAESHYLMRTDSGDHLYGVWYHFVGSVLEGLNEPEPVEEADGFAVTHPQFERVDDRCQIRLSDDADLLPESFKGSPVVQLDLTLAVPWVIDAPEPE